MNHNFYILSRLSKYTDHFKSRKLHGLEIPMLTENIAQDAALLISEEMLHVVQGSTYLVKDIHVEQFERASSLWRCIKSEFQTTEVARKISLDMEATPDNEIVQAIFRHQLSKHLKQDDDFAWNVEHILYGKDFGKSVEKAVPQTNKSKVQEFIPIVNDHKNNQAISFIDINTKDLGEARLAHISGD